MTQPLIRMHDLEKCYGGVRALHVPHFEIADGERVLLTGVNGSGKSTLVRLLAGVGRPTAGQLAIDPGLARQAVGYVPQSGGLHPDTTVRENLSARLRLFGRRPDTRGDRILIEALGIDEVLDTRVSDLSVGYQRLVLMAAALLVRPRWMLWDEPLAGVDANRTAAVTQVLTTMTPTRVFVFAAPELVTIPGLAFSQNLLLKRDAVPCVRR